MTIVCFAYNRNEEAFFKKIAPRIDAKIDIIYVNKRLLITPRAFTACREISVDEEIKFKKRFEAVLSPRVKNPLAAYLKGCYIALMANYLCMKYYTILSQKEYDAIMLWSGVTFRQSIAVKAAKALGLKTLFIENGLLPDTIVLDPKGINYNNSLPRNPDFYRNYAASKEALPQKLIPRKPKKVEKFVKRDEIIPQKYIFIPFQVDYDTQLLLHGSWIKDMRTLFSVMCEVHKNLSDKKLHLVFKEHPSSILDYPDLHTAAANMEHVHIINSTSTQELIERAEAVVTVNSTVGIESLLLKKRVVVLGNAFYAIEGLTKTAKDRETLQEILENLDSWEPDATLREKFLKYLYFQYLVPGGFSSEREEHFRKIDAIIKRVENEASNPHRLSQKRVSPHAKKYQNGASFYR
jgi:capsular polysaccharide export protein